MADETVKCSNCGFENHSSCRFCIQCGKGLKGAAAPSPKSPEPEPHESPEVPKPGTEDLLKRVAKESGYEHEPRRDGWKVLVPLGQDRRQKVYVMFNGHDDDGEDIVSFLSICGEATDRHAMTLLRFNSRIPYGAFAVKTIQGKEYFVATANQLASTADPQEIGKLLFEVARRADAIERQIGGGQDVF